MSQTFGGFTSAIPGLLESIESTTRQGDKTARAVRWAGRAFLQLDYPLSVLRSLS